MQAIHDRMPLEVPADQLDLWLDPNVQTAQTLAPVLRSAPRLALERLHTRPVSSLVNSPRNDGPECLDPPTPTSPTPQQVDRQLNLFASIAARPGREHAR
jgi:putative SOS response-associated peptidase YedK